MPEIFALGTKTDSHSIPLVTRKGTRIDNEQRRPQAPASMKAAIAIHTANHPTLKLRSLSSEYNCVGLVFASRRTFVDIKELSMILREDGFRIVEQQEVQPGDVLVYKDGAGDIVHIAIVLKHDANPKTASWVTKVLSQWGADGEYIHTAEDVAHLLGRPLEFWSERRG